jgi:hypothetical protein
MWQAIFANFWVPMMAPKQLGKLLSALLSSD